MGNFLSRRNSGVEQVDFSNANAYRYPPKSGTYFGTHYIMGGERFETTQPEAYLFGENQDLNFLGNKPVPFPYPAPQTNEPTKTLKSLVNIRRDSVRFVRATEDDSTRINTNDSTTEQQITNNTKYNIEFTFDSDVRCAITVYYFAREEIESKKLVYHPRDATMNSETFRFKRGANQTFNQSTHIIDPSLYPEEDWQFNPDKDIFPVAIHCAVEDEDFVGHSQVTLAIVEKTSEGGFMLKPLKQKQMVDGLCYLLQEIYGIENKSSNRAKDDDVDDSGSECVICMSEMRDTIILSCRHLCLCNVCADSLRYQANNCPICRAPFRALLQIRAMKKKPTNSVLPTSPSTQGGDTAENVLSQEGIPAGYEAVALIEALNGSCAPAPATALHSMHPDGNSTLRSTASSSPTSPDESPIMKQRKMQRQTSQTSMRSHRSIASQSGSVHEEAGATGGDNVDRAPTPVICMTEQAPDPSKSPSQPVKVPKVRYLSPKKVRKADSVEIIDEVRSNEKYGSASSLSPITDSEDLSDVGRTSARSISLAEEEEEIPEEIEAEVEGDEEEDISFPHPAAHTTVLYDSQLDHGDQLPDEDDEATLPRLLDPLSLPGTPAGTGGGDGSSYSSTNSSHGLLSQSHSAREDRPPSPSDCTEEAL